MPRLSAVAILAGCLALGVPALAGPPPADSKPLSEILKALEDSGDVAYFDEVEWDDDDGHWEIEYRSTAGGQVEIEVDPVSGDIRGR